MPPRRAAGIRRRLRSGRAVYVTAAAFLLAVFGFETARVAAGDDPALARQKTDARPASTAAAPSAEAPDAIPAMPTTRAS
jgi:hypothetical protein